MNTAESLRLAIETKKKIPACKKARVCVPAPIGCGQPVGPFRDELSAREYQISGLCQKCQDSIFGP